MFDSFKNISDVFCGIRVFNEKLSQLVLGYNFFNFSNVSSINLNQEIHHHLKKSKIIMINQHKLVYQAIENHYFSIGFEKTVILIKKELLPLINELFSQITNIGICFLSDSKESFDQQIKMKYKEIKYNSNFLYEITNFNRSFITRKDQEQCSEELWLIIQPCITGYLIRKSYEKLNENRIQNFLSNYSNTPTHAVFTDKDYIYLRDVGHGSLFMTILVFHIENEQLLLIKKANIINDESTKLIQREISNYQKLRHPFMPEFYGTIQDSNEIVFEYINGRSIENVDLSTLSYDEIITIIFEIILILDFISYNHLVYRDLKPDNIVLNENKIPVLIDFDRMINVRDKPVNDDDLFTRNFQTFFIAPEVNDGKITDKSDVYSIGLMIYYLMHNKTLPKNDDTKCEKKFF